MDIFNCILFTSLVCQLFFDRLFWDRYDHPRATGTANIDFNIFNTQSQMYHSPIRQSFKLENNFSAVGKSFLNLVKL